MRQRPQILPMEEPRRRGASLSDRIQIAFAILVIVYFVAQILRGLVQHGLLG